MSHINADRVLFTSTTVGTGAYVIGSAVTDYRVPPVEFAVGDTMDLFVESATAGGGWEIVTVTKQGDGSLQRTIVHASSNGGAPVNWGSGTRRLGNALIAERLNYIMQGLDAALGASGGGGSVSKTMRMVQEVLAQAPHHMAFNRFISAPATSAVITALSSLPGSGYERSYAASVADMPLEWYGVKKVVMEDWGVRAAQATFSGTNQIARAVIAELGLIGSSCIVTVEKGYNYRVILKQDGVERYDDSGLLSPAGTGQQLYRIDLPGNELWEVSIEFLSAGSNELDRVGRLGPCYARQADSGLVRLPKKGPKIMFVSSSYIQDVGGAGGKSWANVAAGHLGIKDCVISAVHSTTETVSDIGGHIWSARRADWIEAAPDILVFVAQPGSGLDHGQTTTQEINAIMAEVNYARTNLPDTLIVVEFQELPDSGTDLMTVINGVLTQVAALDDPFTVALNTFADPSLMNWLFPLPDGPSTWMVSGHYSAAGDMQLGRYCAQNYLRMLRGISYGEDTNEAVLASIFPGAANLSLTVGTPVNLLLGTIAGGSPTSIVSGTAPAGCTFSLSGQQLRLSGTPTTVAGSINSTIVVSTSNGSVNFNLAGSVAAAAVASITPTGGSQSLQVGTAVNVVLGTISNGTPSSITSGTAPAGCSFSLVGQTLKLTGTPTTVSGSIATAIVVATDNGDVTFNLTGSVAAAGAAIITPSSGSQSLTVGTAVNVLLGTVSGGTPSSITGGTAPAGTSFTLSGQQLRLSGTPTTVAGSIATTITVATDNGDVTFGLTGSVAASGGDAFIADVVAILNGGGYANDRTGSSVTFTPTGTAPASEGGYLDFDGSPGTPLAVSANPMGAGYTGSWCMEFKLKFVLANASIMASVNGENGSWDFNCGSNGKIAMYIWSSIDWISTGTFADGAEIDLSFDYDSVADVLRVYVNGTLDATYTELQKIDWSYPILVGNRPNFGDSFYQGGLKFRLTKAVRHTGASYTVPTWPVPVA